METYEITVEAVEAEDVVKIEANSEEEAKELLMKQYDGKIEIISIREVPLKESEDEFFQWLRNLGLNEVPDYRAEKRKVMWILEDYIDGGTGWRKENRANFCLKKLGEMK